MYKRILYFLIVLIGFSLQSGYVFAEITYVDDTTVYTDNSTSYTDSFTKYTSDNTRYIEDMTAYIEASALYAFSEEIDNLYIINYQTQEYINSHIVIQENYSLDMEKIAKNFMIGGGATLCAAIISVTLPGTGAVLIPVIISIQKQALMGAAIGAALKGITTAIKTGGNGDAVLKGVLEEASEGYKWAALTASVNQSIKSIKLSKKYVDGRKKIERMIKETPLSDEEISSVKKYHAPEKVRNSQIADKQLDETPKKIGRAPQKDNLPTKEISSGKKYHTAEKLRNRQLVDKQLSETQKGTIINYTKEGGKGSAKELNGYLREGGDPEKNKYIKHIDAAFEKIPPLEKTMTVHRGQGASPETLKSIGLENIYGKDGKIILEKLPGQIITEKGYTSTSKAVQVAQDFARYSGEPEQFIRHIKLPAGIKGMDVNKVAGSWYSGEEEILLGHGLKTKIIDAYRDSSGIIHLIEEVVV